MASIADRFLAKNSTLARTRKISHSFGINLNTEDAQRNNYEMHSCV